ncbi:HNH endonuclease signature motif containing protein [Raineyella sp. LH-20]|uniref:HNH endonuclease signature motif containing protein n=1 Tax=Raineyella sp. LH-20 TaxID=3081204 RepID=UPI002953A67A|nr:DUF222 domain-containing protein [Raineyella sp. LH-20]WOP19334.1 DUF222 domain-containing protein [Raineyella sp. LH-20]
MWDWSEAVDVDRMPRARAEDVGVGIQGAATAQARCDAQLVALVGEFDAGAGWGWYEGITSCTHWLMWACSMSAGTAREHLRVARALRAMPTVAERFGEGVLSYSKVRELTRLAGQVDETELCELACLQTASQLARTVREYRAHAGAHLAQQSRRRLTWRETNDGMVRLSVTLPPEEAAVLRGAVDAATDRLLDAPAPSDPGATDLGPTAPGSTEPGSIDPGLADPDTEPSPPAADPVAGLCDVARSYLATMPGSSTDDPHLVVVHVDAECLAASAADATDGANDTDLTDGVGQDVPAGTSTVAAPDTGQRPGRPYGGRAWIERGGPIEAATAARHACDAPLVGMLIDRNGDVLAMGRTRRLASPAQRRALRVRDGSCRFPGCGQHRRLKAHHIVSWVDGGATDLDNLILLCQAHHTYVHEGGVRLTGRPGDWRFVLPDGTAIHPTGPGTPPAPDQIEEIVRRATEASAAHPDRVFPVGAGEGFRLVECVQRLFDIQLPAAA